MVEFETRGVPTVSFTARAFERDAHRSAETFGLVQLPIAVVAAPFTSQPVEAINSLVEACIDQVVSGLTTEVPSTERESEVTVLDEDWLTFSGDDLLDAASSMNRQFLDYGWTDGFPLVPPTDRLLAAMLSGTSRSPEDVVAILEPGFGIATVEKIAANAVMAGCRPEHLPVLLAAVECLAEPKMDLRNKAMSTGPHAPLILINGPIRSALGINSGVCALGPGAPSYANTVIGRALRLCMMNVGHTYPRVSDMDTVGSPTKYSLCVAENEEANPWAPYHVDRGFDSGTSTVTVQFVYGICELRDFQNHDPARLTDVFATAATNLAQQPTGLWLIGRRADPRYGTDEMEHHLMLICPEHAAKFAQAGWKKDDIRKAMHQKARLPFSMLMLNKEPEGMAIAHPELSWLWDSPNTLVPVLEDSECYDIAVVGGAGSSARGSFFYGAGEPITKPVGE